ncbi:MAG: peptidylprolyl isomerase [Terriglobales bacterium]
MRYWWLVFVLFTLLALERTSVHAQAVPAGNSTPGDKSGLSVSRNVPPDAAVITIDGLCGSDSYSIAEPDAAAKTPGSTDSKATSSRVALNPSCRTIITRAQFEKLASVVAPNQPPHATAELARFYSDQLLFAREARELGIDKDPHFDEILNFTYLQVLARAMNERLARQADMTDAEFAKYYKEHVADFEQVELLQISIPKQKSRLSPSGATSQAKVDPAADEATMKAEAEKIYTQAVAGGDFATLQEEAYTVAGDPDDAPDADMGLVTRSELGDTQAEVFALQPGQISKLISGKEAWHIFKVVSRQMMSESDAKRLVTGQRTQAAVDSLKKSVKPRLNDAYFGSSASSEQAQSSGGEQH